MANKGIDYGMGTTNVDPDNGIRFGVIGMNSEHLSEWAWESMEADYGDPHCPKCGGEAEGADADGAPDFDETDWCANCEHNHGAAFVGGVAGTKPDPHCHDCDCKEPDFKEWEEGRRSRDYYCASCRYVFDSEEAYGDEALGHDLDSDGYVGRVGSSNDLFVTKSPFYTRAQFCSPCAPGAGHLEHPMDEGERTYCLGHDWFRHRVAPYPVFEVATGRPVAPELGRRFKTEDGYTLTLVATTLDTRLGWSDGDHLFRADPHGRPLEEDGTPLEGEYIDGE